MPEDPERRRWRYANDPEYRARVDARTRAYREANRERIRARRRVLYAADPEKHRAGKQAWSAANPDKIAQYRRRSGQRRDRDKDAALKLIRLHGITPDQWRRIWDAQGGRCYLCGGALAPGVQVKRGSRDKPVVDHVHAHCGPRRSCAACRRGIACSPCNLIIGWAQDDPARLLLIAERLTAANSAARDRIAALPEELSLF